MAFYPSRARVIQLSILFIAAFIFSPSSAYAAERVVDFRYKIPTRK